MLDLEYKYGRQIKTLKIQGDIEVDTILPNKIPQPKINFQQQDISQILKLFINKLNKNISDIRVGIAINDKSRPVPYHMLMPPLVNALEVLGIPNASILLPMVRMNKILNLSRIIFLKNT